MMNVPLQVHKNFALWRSTSSRISLSMNWMISYISGREINEPVLKRKETTVSNNNNNNNNNDNIVKGNDSNLDNGSSRGNNIQSPLCSVECFGTPLRRNPTIALVPQSRHAVIDDHNDVDVYAVGNETKKKKKKKRFFGLF
jgi:hypothetical protein